MMAPRKRSTRRRRNPEASETEAPTLSSTAPVIVFDLDSCAWSIPSSWWSGIARPRLRAYLRGIEGVGATWQDRRASVQSGFSATDAAYAILRGQTGACPLPPVGTDTANLGPNTTPVERSMAALVNHVTQAVQQSQGAYFQSQGSRLELSEPPSAP